MAVQLWKRVRDTMRLDESTVAKFSVTPLSASEDAEFIRRYFPTLFEIECMMSAQCAAPVAAAAAAAAADPSDPSDADAGAAADAVAGVQAAEYVPDTAAVAAMFGASQLPSLSYEGRSLGRALCDSDCIEDWVKHAHAAAQADAEEAAGAADGAPLRAVLVHGSVLMYDPGKPSDVYVLPNEAIEARVRDPATHFEADVLAAQPGLAAARRYDGEPLPSCALSQGVPPATFCRSSTELLETPMARSGVDGVPCDPLMLTMARLMHVPVAPTVAGDTSLSPGVKAQLLGIPMFRNSRVEVSVAAPSATNSRSIARRIHLLSFSRGPDKTAEMLVPVHGGETLLNMLAPARLNPSRVACMFQDVLKEDLARNMELPTQAEEYDTDAAAQAALAERVRAAVQRIDPYIFVGARQPHAAMWDTDAVYAVDFIAASHLMVLRGLTKLGLETVFGAYYDDEDGVFRSAPADQQKHLALNTTLLEVMMAPFSVVDKYDNTDPAAAESLQSALFVGIPPAALATPNRRLLESLIHTVVSPGVPAAYVVSCDLDRRIAEAFSHVAALVLGPAQTATWQTIGKNMSSMQKSAFLAISVERTVGAMCYEETTGERSYTVDDLIDFRSNMRELIDTGATPDTEPAGRSPAQGSATDAHAAAPEAAVDSVATAFMKKAEASVAVQRAEAEAEAVETAAASADGALEGLAAPEEAAAAVRLAEAEAAVATSAAAEAEAQAGVRLAEAEAAASAAATAEVVASAEGALEVATAAAAVATAASSAADAEVAEAEAAATTSAAALESAAAAEEGAAAAVRTVVAAACAEAAADADAPVVTVAATLIDTDAEKQARVEELEQPLLFGAPPCVEPVSPPPQ
jgi:hypothetical protein